MGGMAAGGKPGMGGMAAGGKPGMGGMAAGGMTMGGMMMASGGMVMADAGPPDAPAPDMMVIPDMLSPNGTTCSSGGTCLTGHCVDGFCCDNACTGLCRACNVAGKAGTCTFFAPGTNSLLCAAEAKSTCGRDGACDGNGACRLWTTGTECVAPSCSGAIITPARTCDGMGLCRTPTGTSCGRFLCTNTTACPTSCTTIDQCTAGSICRKTACILPKIAGLVVHDTANAAGWSIQYDFAIGMMGSHPWSDTLWMNTYILSMDMGANFLIGDEWIKVVAESKKYVGSGGFTSEATVTLNGTADVYLMIDDRFVTNGKGIKWATDAGWVDTMLNMVIYESTTRPALTFSIFKKTATNTVELPIINDTPAYNYFVIVD
jgi:hypothetical protein